MAIETLQPNNKFSFTCPIFNAQTEMRACVALREQVYMGKRMDVRKGCQACISGGKCPANEIVRRLAFRTGDMTDHCASKEHVTGKIPADVLERIRPTILTEALMTGFKVSTQERDLIASSGDRITAQISTAPRAASSRVSPDVTMGIKPRTKSAAPRPKTENATVSAASSGDLSAAINQEKEV